MSKKLTPEYVVMRTKCDRLEKLKNLNLWGCDLEDVTVLRQIPNLEVVSLSVNKIKSLKEFGTLKQLKELYLRKNFISDISEIRFLEKCPNLKVLWLSENPIADSKNYRKIVIKSLPNLTKLDDNLVSAEERIKAMEEGNDEDNYGDGDEEGNRSSDSMDHPKEENVFETKNYHNKNIPATTSATANTNAANKFSNNVNDNLVKKKSITPSEDNFDNEQKSNFKNVKEKKTNNVIQQNNDMYPIQNEAKKITKDKPAPVTNKYSYDNQQYEEPIEPKKIIKEKPAPNTNKYNYDNQPYEEPIEPKKIIKEKPAPNTNKNNYDNQPYEEPIEPKRIIKEKPAPVNNKYNYDNQPYEEPAEPKRIIKEKPAPITNKYSYDNQPYEEPTEPKRIIKEKPAPISNKYNYESQQYEDQNVADKFENLKIGGASNVYTKKNDLRRESRPNPEVKNNDNSFNNSEHRNEFRTDLKKKNSIKEENYNETLKEFNNLNTRKSIENIPTKTPIASNSTNRSNNVMNCVMMLLKELNDYDLEIVKDEIDQRLGNK